MLTFIIRRLLWTVLVMFVITVIVFIIFFKTPGVDPARALAGRNPSPQVLAEIRAQLGLNRPFPIQYGIMMKKIFITRDLVSYSNQGVQVVPEIGAATPATLSLVFGAAVIWVVMAIGVGIAAALLRGTVFDPLLMVVALVGVSAPVFWVGQLANMVTSGGPAQHVPVQLGAAARVHAVHAEPVAVVQGAGDPVDNAVDPVHRLLRARAARQYP